MTSCVCGQEREHLTRGFLEKVSDEMMFTISRQDCLKLDGQLMMSQQVYWGQRVEGYREMWERVEGSASKREE